jgi:hypothetical protein
VIVRDAGDSWQIVLQTDHADLSAQFLKAWRGDESFARPHPFASVLIATARHDDGWSVWERAPGLDPRTGAPRTFVDVQVRSHLAFYRACIEAVTDQDPYAGLLVSMHGAGIYRGRYETQPSLKITHAGTAKEQVDAFVQQQEDDYPRRIGELRTTESECWTNYRFLQIYDRLSLYVCMNDLEEGTPITIKPVPTDYKGSEATLEIEPAEPWRVYMDPFPFAQNPAHFTLLRRLMPKRTWTEDEFRQAFFATELRPTEITVERA